VTALLLVVLLFLLVVNGVFVAAEFALVRARRSRVESLAQQDTAGARRVLEQMERMDEYLSACQVGITMASIGIGFLGEPAVAELLIDVFGLSSGFAHAAAIAFAFAFVTAMHISIGEQVPKMIAIDKAEPTARLLSRPVEWFRIATSPFTVALTAVSNGVVRLFGVNPDELEQEHTTDDVKSIIDQSRLGGQLDPNEAGMLTGVFHLHEQEAREVMTPIPAVVTVDADESVETALRRCVSSGHTRLLVIEEDNPDRVRGVVHNNAVARLYLNAGADAAIEEVIHDAYIVPETKPLDDLLAELQRQRSYIGVVVDEYGRTVGIVTVEDILEEVVGEIEDETDPTTTAVRRLANGDWYVRGHVPLGDLADVGIELPVDTDAYNSIGGYVFGELGRLPKRGDAIRADGYQIRVESVRENRIVAVRIHPPDAEHTPAAEEPVV
jgi:CBS domain containing-hemolysin-like protein